MNNTKRRPNSGLKTLGNTIMSRKTTTTNSNQNPNNLTAFKSENSKSKNILINTSNKQQGNGLWCVNTDRTNQIHEENENQRQKTEASKNTKTPDMSNEFDKKIIESLKYKNKDLQEQLHFALAKAADMEYKTTRFEHQMDYYNFDHQYPTIQ